MTIKAILIEIDVAAPDGVDPMRDSRGIRFDPCTWFTDHRAKLILPDWPAAETALGAIR